MKFKDYKYVRPNLDEDSKKIIELGEKLSKETNKEKAIEIITEAQKISDHFGTMGTLCSIRNSINTLDKFYEEEQEFFDTNSPKFSAACVSYSKALVNSPIRKELEEVYGKQVFILNELNLKGFDEKIIDELVEEARLSTEYDKLMASAKIEFQGKVNNLSQMTPYLNSLDRKTRKEATLKMVRFMESIETKIDDIYDKLVKVRTKMAKKMGYDNYVDFGYLRLGRSDYNSKDVKKYRDQIAKDVVPVCKRIIEKQKERIGIKDLKSYDLPIFYKDGNPNHGKDKDTLVKGASKFYHALSKETGKFFDMMCENELMDLESKQGKRGGGYCTMIPDYKVPFIFSNFNGTMGDVDVLTHEAGHAFEAYTASLNLAISDVYFPTLEACEIHSMSMEFFAHPYMDYFFDTDAAKYRYKHLAEAILFLPYGASIDEFQHFVYENPEATPQERKAKWHEIELKYTPWKDYDGIKYYENGNFWQKQGHVFSTAFYYIDYTLAQVCAFQFLLLDHKNHEEAWKKYYDLCKLGGSKSFTGLLKAVNLDNPFEDGYLSKIMPQVEALLKELELN